MFRNVLGEDTVMNLKEFKQYGGNLDEDVASNLKEVVNLYPMRRKTPCFSYGDIRRVHRIYASN